MTNVGAFLRQQQAAATSTHWQLVALSPTQHHGLFKAWVLVDSNLWAIKLQVGQAAGWLAGWLAGCLACCLAALYSHPATLAPSCSTTCSTWRRRRRRAQVPRTLYINSSLPPTDPRAAELGRPISRTLPSGQKPQHL